MPLRSRLQKSYSPIYRKTSENILTWFKCLEALADFFGFSKIQKFIFVEYALKELALLLVGSESWQRRT